AQIVRDRPAALRVAHRGDDLRRLVEGEVDPVGVRRDPQRVDVHRLDLRVDAGAQLADDDAVDLHTALRDEGFARAARTQSGVGEDLLQPHAALAVDGRHRAGVRVGAGGAFASGGSPGTVSG